MGEDGSGSMMGAAIGGLIGGLIGLVVGLAVVIGMWKLFTKAGKPGFYAIIPILNLYTLVQITGLPMSYFWYWILSLALSGPTFGLAGLVGLFVTFIVMRQLRRVYGQSDDIVSVIVFIIFSVVTIPMLGLGAAQYRGAQESADVPKLPWIS